MSDSKKFYYEIVVILEGDKFLGEGEETHTLHLSTDHDLTLFDDKAYDIVDTACWAHGDCGELMMNSEDYANHVSYKTLAGYEVVYGPSDEHEE